LIHAYLLKPKHQPKAEAAGKVLFYLSSLNPDVVYLKIVSVISNSANEKDSDELFNQV